MTAIAGVNRQTQFYGAMVLAPEANRNKDTNKVDNSFTLAARDQAQQIQDPNGTERLLATQDAGQAGQQGDKKTQSMNDLMGKLNELFSSNPTDMQYA